MGTKRARRGDERSAPVDIFDAAAVAGKTGGGRPSATLTVSSTVWALLLLPGGGLAAGTLAGTVELFDAAAVAGKALSLIHI